MPLNAGNANVVLMRNLRVKSRRLLVLAVLSLFKNNNKSPMMNNASLNSTKLVRFFPTVYLTCVHEHGPPLILLLFKLGNCLRKQVTKLSAATFPGKHWKMTISLPLQGGESHVAAGCGLPAGSFSSSHVQFSIHHRQLLQLQLDDVFLFGQLGLPQGDRFFHLLKNALDLGLLFKPVAVFTLPDVQYFLHVSELHSSHFEFLAQIVDLFQKEHVLLEERDAR